MSTVSPPFLEALVARIPCNIAKWQYPSRNFAIYDVVVLIEDGLTPTRWPLARVMKVYPGNDGVVRVVDIMTSRETYRRLVHKLAPLLVD